MYQRRVIEFQDRLGSRLDVVTMRHLDGRWTVQYVYRYRKGGVERGATSICPNERSANARQTVLETAALEKGWRYRICEKTFDDAPAPIHFDECGNKLFRDLRTGIYRRDLSSFSPLVSLHQVSQQEPDGFTEIFAPCQ